MLSSVPKGRHRFENHSVLLTTPNCVLKWPFIEPFDIELQLYDWSRHSTDYVRPMRAPILPALKGAGRERRNRARLVAQRERG